MTFGLCTHFRFPVAAEVLAQVRAFGFTMGRADLRDCTPEEAAGLIGDLDAADLTPYVILRDAGQVTALRALIDSPLKVECQNEPDLHSTVQHYRDDLSEMAEATELAGYELYGGVVSNLNERGFKFLRACWPFPAGVKVAIHRYAPHVHADESQQGSHSRAQEIQKLKAIIGDRPWGCSECGFSVDGRLTEDQQAAEIRRDFQFWESTDAEFSCLFQLGCGPGPSREENYGIRNFSGEWRPSAHVLETL
jgi:hypothetical protein